MSVKLTQSTADEFRRRILKLTPDSRRRWGTMTVEEMLAHLCVSLELSLGDRKAPDQSNLFTRTILRFLVFHVLPWPKGKVKAPEYFLAEAGGFEEERQRLLGLLDRFVTKQSLHPRRRIRNPVFGALTLRYWGRVNGKHMDHHLRQFGV